MGCRTEIRLRGRSQGGAGAPVALSCRGACVGRSSGAPGRTVGGAQNSVLVRQP